MVTNPAIDREREIEHFSLRTVLGRRPQMRTGKQVRPHKRMELTHPVLLGGHLQEDVMPPEMYRAWPRTFGTYVLEDLLAGVRRGPRGGQDHLRPPTGPTRACAVPCSASARRRLVRPGPTAPT